MADNAYQLVLGLETSCDETSVALLHCHGDRCRVRANLIASQVDAHQLFGGVVPEIASRQHLEAINPLLEQLRHDTGISWPDLDLVAVTHGPGLVGALMVGVAAAKALSFATRVPIRAVNHIEGHIASVFLQEPLPPLPLLCLVVSGGHSDLVLVRGHGSYTRLGRTRDDAVGEAFDKVARTLGLPMPGGPLLEKLAAQGDDVGFAFTASNLEPSYDFSFSGLKTAAAQAMARQPARVADIAASFQRCAVHQLSRTVARLLEEGVDGQRIGTLGVCGGVAANGALRQALASVAAGAGVPFVVPDKVLCTDNAAMIAAAGYYRWAGDGQPAFSVDSLGFDVHSLLPIA